MCHGFRPIVPKECSGDRAIGPHEANLFDMDQKYADVMSLEEVKDKLGHADRRPVGTPERHRLTAPQITCSAASSFSFAFE